MSGKAAAIFVGLAAFGGVAYALSRSEQIGPVDGVNWDSLPYDFLDIAETFVNVATEQPATVPNNTAAANVAAFLAVIRAAEGTDREPDPYRVVMGFGHTLQNLSDHPYFTGEWMGAAFGNGEWSTAAGAYQFIRKTWSALRDKLGLPDFGPASQDAAAIELIRERGALSDVQAGRIYDAVPKVRRVWASLPSAGYGQAEMTMDWVARSYTTLGGKLA